MTSPAASHASTSQGKNSYGAGGTGQIAVPAAGVLVAGFVLYHNIWPGAARAV